MQETSLIASLRVLSEGNVEFILVGGLAAVLQGAPIQTYDVDVVYALHGANIDSLLLVLSFVDAIFRFQPARKLRPNRTHLAAGGHLNLLTSHGPLDLLGSIGKGLAFSELLPHSRKLQVTEELSIQVLSLSLLIELKEQLGSEKDLAVLPILRRTLSELERSS